jgi:hypothetical protein
MIHLAIILAHQAPIDLQPGDILKDISVIRLIEQVDLIDRIGTKSKMCLSKPFTSLLNANDPNLRFSFDQSDGTKTFRGFGTEYPCIVVNSKGLIIRVTKTFKSSSQKFSHLNNEQLIRNLKQAISICRPDMKDQDLQYIKRPFPYATEEIKRIDPYASYDIYASKYGLRCGPGNWGSGSLMADTGECYILIFGPTTSTLNDDPGKIISPQEAEDRAADAILGLKEVDLTNCIERFGKIVTGAPFIGKGFYKYTPRVKSVIKNHLGAIAYSFRYGNGKFASDGRPILGYDILVDGRTGEALTISDFAAYGAAGGSDSPVKFVAPTRPVNAILRWGKRKISLTKISFLKLNTPPRASTTTGTIQVGEVYAKAEIASRYEIKISGIWYSLK